MNENFPHPLDAFDRRAKSYTPARVGGFNESNRKYPNVRATERHLLLNDLRLEPGLTICDAAAGGGYVAEGIADAFPGQLRVICVENSQSFLDSIEDRFAKVLCSLLKIDLPAQSVDRVSCLAGLHHQENKQAFFHEASRILKPGGRIAVADVLEGSPPAKFLNISVDQFTEIGHDGMFVQHGDFANLLNAAGIISVQEHFEQFTWDFPDRQTMVGFCKSLFRMDLATPEQVETEVFRYLPVTESAEKTQLHWSLVYATGGIPV